MSIFAKICMVGFTGASLILPPSRTSAATDPAPAAAQPYKPPAESAAVLGKIADLVSRAKVVPKDQFGRHGATFIGTLPGGELYFEVPTIDVDDDGDADGSPAGWESHPVRAGKIDSFRQEQTSYGGRLPREAGHTDAISPFKVPYIVLPGGKKPFWFSQRGMGIGDGAMIIRNGKCVEAVFADAGPTEKIGEMSLMAHQLFGETVIVDGLKARLGADGKPLRDPATQKLLTDPAKVTRNSASKGPFVVIVFPGTSVGRSFKSVDGSLKTTIDQRFQGLVQ